jgi:hypothetical protein
MSALGTGWSGRAGVRAVAWIVPWMVLAAVMLLATMMLCAQAGREAYRNAYRAWREVDPNLERDAATGGAQLGVRADRVAAEAAKYCEERRAFLDRFAQESEQKLAWLEIPAEASPKLPTAAGDYISGQTAAIRRGIDTLAKDPDPGIQRVRNIMERENIALSVLNAAIAARQKTAEQVDLAMGAMEPVRLKALDLNRAFAAGTKLTGQRAAAEAPAWGEYYRKLSDGARGVSATGPVSSLIPTRVADPGPRSAPSVAPLPLVRYTGDWIFPAKGMYHGPQPEFVDLVVREDNGRCEGRMVARFILPPGSAGDPVLRFEFSGEFKNSARQTFPLTTSDGASGTVDLIPGGAFNLLEINVQIAATPGKVRQANVVLIKK